MRAHIITLIVLALILAFLLNSATDEEFDAIADIEILTEQNFDYFMTDVDSSHFNAEGQVDYRLRARRFTHYPDPEYTTIEAPDMVIYQDSRSSPWFISADHGRITTNIELQQEQLELSDNVVIHHIDTRGSNVYIYTDFITVYPDAKQLSTEHSVMVDGDEYRQSSIGMTADLNSNIIKFLSTVEGRYE